MVDAQQIAEKVRDLLLGELRDEFKEFKAEVRGQLEGFRLAIETMNRRLDSLEMNINKRIDSVERRLANIENEVRSLRGEMSALNRRVDDLVKELSEVKVELKELKARDEIIQDLVRRISKLEEKIMV